jgi:hypothetical protein
MTLVLLTAYPNCRVYSEEGNLDYYIAELSPGHTNQLPPHVGNPELAFAWSLPRGLWPLATHYDQLCLVTCSRPSTCGPGDAFETPSHSLGELHVPAKWNRIPA